MRHVHLALALLFAALALPRAAVAAQPASVRAILISASNAKTEADPRLRPYEAELQRNMPESSFRFVSEGSASVPTGGRSTLTLGGHRLELEREPADGQGISLQVEWRSGGKVLLRTSLKNLQRGVPAVLGRRPVGNGETPMILIFAQ